MNKSKIVFYVLFCSGLFFEAKAQPLNQIPNQIKVLSITIKTFEYVGFKSMTIPIADFINVNCAELMIFKQEAGKKEEKIKLTKIEAHNNILKCEITVRLDVKFFKLKIDARRSGYDVFDKHCTIGIDTLIDAKLTRIFPTMSEPMYNDISDSSSFDINFFGGNADYYLTRIDIHSLKLPLILNPISFPAGGLDIKRFITVTNVTRSEENICSAAYLRTEGADKILIIIDIIKSNSTQKIPADSTLILNFKISTQLIHGEILKNTELSNPGEIKKYKIELNQSKIIPGSMESSFDDKSRKIEILITKIFSQTKKEKKQNKTPLKPKDNRLSPSPNNSEFYFHPKKKSNKVPTVK